MCGCVLDLRQLLLFNSSHTTSDQIKIEAKIKEHGQRALDDWTNSLYTDDKMEDSEKDIKWNIWVQFMEWLANKNSYNDSNYNL